MHNSYKVGRYWERIPNYGERGHCRECDTTETMEHILTECRASGQTEIWALTKELCEKKSIPWSAVIRKNIRLRSR